MLSELQKDILSTIIYYDILDYPLTPFEIWKNMIRYEKELEEDDRGKNEMSKATLKDVFFELEERELKMRLEEYRGLYFLRGKKDLAQRRILKNKISDEKWKIIERTARFIRFVPFVRMVAVTGRMAMKNAEKESDLDLLIVLKGGRIFTGRLLVTAMVHLLGVRRHGEKITDRICLNYFITDKSLEITLQDLFSSSEYSHMVPVFGWKKFLKFQKKNRWILNYRENFGEEKIANMRMVDDYFFSKFLRKAGEKLLHPKIIERSLEKWQMKRIMSDPRTHKVGSFVTANKNELIFLPDPQGPAMNEAFEKKLKEAL